MNLQELYDSKGHEYYPTDKGTDHSYLQIYSELFHPFQDKKINLIEIGICHGGGMRLFSEWFSQANIIGYDITDRYLTVPLGIRSRAIFKDLKTFVFNEFAFFPPHIIIDDATHFIEDQLKMVKVCYPQLQKGGLLIIEDITNIDKDKSKFDLLNIPYKIIDLRSNKNKSDDVLIIYEK